MPSVLEVCDYHGPYPGNFIPSLIAVGHAARERLDLDYHCAFPAAMADRPWVQQIRDAGFEVHWLDEDAGARTRIRTLRSIVRETDPAVIRTHFTAWDLIAGAVGSAARIPVVWNIHTGAGAPSARRRLADLVKVRALHRLARAVIVVSQAVLEESLARGFPETKVRLVWNGIDRSRFGDEVPERAAARDELGIEPASRVVLAFGWQPHFKGIDVLYAAVGDPTPLDGVCLLIVGADALRASLPSPPPPWLEIVQPVQDPRALYAAADVFVSASRREAFSYAIGEAMAMRLPVVSSDLPGPSIYFGADGVRTYPAEDALALRAAIDEVLAWSDRTRGEANRRYVMEHLPLERHVEGVIDVLRSVMRT